MPDLRSVTSSLDAIPHDSPTRELAEAIVNCEACTMRPEARQPTPFWPRNTPSPVMLVGRNPGINEDEIGRPFVGRGGELFQAWLNGLGITRDDIWLTNLCKCYTTADRKPKQKEIDTCFQLHLRREILFCKPRLIVPMDAEAFAACAGKDRLSIKHGMLYDRHAFLNAYVMGIIHPGSALRDAGYLKMLLDDGKRLKPLLHHMLAGEPGLPAGYEPQ